MINEQPNSSVPPSGSGEKDESAAVGSEEISPQGQKGEPAREQVPPRQKGVVKKEGVVVEAFPGARFKVQLNEGGEVSAHISGKMRLYRIRILPGDRVTVEFSPYDQERGRIVYRSK